MYSVRKCIYSGGASLIGLFSLADAYAFEAHKSSRNTYCWLNLLLLCIGYIQTYCGVFYLHVVSFSLFSFLFSRFQWLVLIPLRPERDLTGTWYSTNIKNTDCINKMQVKLSNRLFFYMNIRLEGPQTKMLAELNNGLYLI